MNFSTPNGPSTLARASLVETSDRVKWDSLISEDLFEVSSQSLKRREAEKMSTFRSSLFASRHLPIVLCPRVISTSKQRDYLGREPISIRPYCAISKVGHQTHTTHTHTHTTHTHTHTDCILWFSPSKKIDLICNATGRGFTPKLR